jgi:hypothetical protein
MGFEVHGIIQIGADALKLRRPGGERIRFVIVNHIAHGDREQVQIVLDAQQLEGILAVAVNQFGLKLAQTCDLPRDVRRVGDDRGERDDQAKQQA